MLLGKPALLLACHSKLAEADRPGPPLTEVSSPFARLKLPPVTDAPVPLAVFPSPPLTEARFPLAVLVPPPLTEAPPTLAVLFSPPPDPVPPLLNEISLRYSCFSPSDSGNFTLAPPSTMTVCPVT